LILPGNTIGVLGSGQLGRMFAIAARQMGYRVHTYSPDSDTPTGQVSDLEITAPYEDLDAIREFASNVAAVTFEFENVPAATAAAVEAVAPVRPSGHILHTTQHRLREKTFLRDNGFPVTPFEAIRSAADIRSTGILKTAGFGYDGKGQYRITSLDQAQAAWDSLHTDEAVLEQLVDFDCEFSIVAARGVDGDYVQYAPSRNEHTDGILDVSVAPFEAPPEAGEIARAVLETLDVVGVLCVEFFLTKSGKILINELAPRPHNSGHLTIDACRTSQFEQQLRAVCGLPLGATDMFRPAAMANLLGDIWQKGEPNWAAALAQPGIKLHLYGKLEPRPGRKMGHLTATSPDAESLVRRARASLAHQP
jgi:5-(carboxyamino)imidazole ribonucleotide synthase